MGYTMLEKQENPGNQRRKNKYQKYDEFSLKGAALLFIRESCEGLRFSREKEREENKKGVWLGTSLNKGQIPYNMEMDIDRLCMENAAARFLDSGKKEDAFDVYFCYLEMFVGDYEKTRRMIELLSEFELNGSELLMKHRDHYSHSVYVFILGLAVYEKNAIYQEAYKNHYKINDDREAAYHFMRYWGLASLFHDIGYPFELPFEQAAAYFEVNGDRREDRPFLAYHGLESYIKLNKSTQRKLGKEFGLGTDKMLESTNDLFAYALYQKLGSRYYFSEEEMLGYLVKKPTEPDKFGHFMDHAYFSATVLFKKLFEDVKVDVTKDWSIKHIVDSLTAVILHNSLYKFSIAFYKNPDANIRLKVDWHPLAFMLMLCDELQCWDRTAYGRNSRQELHPMDCRFDLKKDMIKATYIFDRAEAGKIKMYDEDKVNNEKAELKAYSSYDKMENIVRDDGRERKVCRFQADIERILDLSRIRLKVYKRQSGPSDKVEDDHRKRYLSDSSYINLYNFAVVLNGRWESDEWKKARKKGLAEEEKYLMDKRIMKKLNDSFGSLSLEYKLSNINQAKGFAKYMNEIGCFYTDKTVDFEMVDSFSSDELVKIGVMEHKRWLQEHYDMGWEYGKPEKKERDFVRLHKAMIPGFPEDKTDVEDADAKEHYDSMDGAQQDKDTEPMECMLAMLKMYDGLRIYRLIPANGNNTKDEGSGGQ